MQQVQQQRRQRRQAQPEQIHCQPPVSSVRLYVALHLVLPKCFPGRDAKAARYRLAGCVLSPHCLTVRAVWGMLV